MFGLRFWGISALYAAGAALLIGIPGVLIPNHLFMRVRVLRHGCPIRLKEITPPENIPSLSPPEEKERLQ